MKNYKIGVLGAGRGVDLANNFKLLGCEIVALCDNDESRLKYGVDRLADVPTFTDFDEFLNCEMDAVIVANLFHQHSSYVIKCFEKGLHVFCECISNGTMAEALSFTVPIRIQAPFFSLRRTILRWFSTARCSEFAAEVLSERYCMQRENITIPLI